jgi:adenylate kinase family enzyme
LYFEASNEVLTKRLLKRGETSGRTDDNLESIVKRLKTFEDSSMPVIKHFEAMNRLKKVNSERDVKEVTKDTLKSFE